MKFLRLYFINCIKKKNYKERFTSELLKIKLQIPQTLLKCLQIKYSCIEDELNIRETIELLQLKIMKLNLLKTGKRHSIY
jgi:hypothetical protein